jgi:galactosamine-6-phosphate isomerase
MAAWLAAHGPIDFLVLGLGLNGHLGFNEPAENLQDGPHVAKLSEDSLAHSMLNGNKDRVRYGLTLGMGDILRSRKIMLLVSGSHKAGQLKRAFSQPVTARFPASFLQRHSNVTIFCDRAAAGELR